MLVREKIKNKKANSTKRKGGRVEKQSLKNGMRLCVREKDKE